MPISSKKTLENMTKAVFCVVNYPTGKDINVDSFCEKLSLNGFQYALIKHINEPCDDGSLKTNHIHVFLESAKRHRLSWYINRIDDCMGFNESHVDCISCFVANDKPGCIQYLIHKNNPEKFQYNATDIMSNINGVEDYLNAEMETSIDIFRLADIVSTSSSRIDIMYSIGLGRYAMYRNVINDMIQCGLLGLKNKNEVSYED